MFDYKKEIGSNDGCPHNEGVSCDKHNCSMCGWNPEVARRRTLEYFRKKGEEKDDS